MYTKYSDFSSSSSSFSSTIPKLRALNYYNNINQLSTNFSSIPYPSYSQSIPSISYNYNNIPNSHLSFIGNQIISPKNNIQPYIQKRFSYNNNNINNNNNFIKGSPVPIHHDLKNSQCCAHNGCSAYISDVLHLLKEMKALGIDKINKEEESEEDEKGVKKGTNIKKFNKKKKRETVEEKKRKTKIAKWWKLLRDFINIYCFFSVTKKYVLNYSPLRNTQIELRTHAFEDEVDILKEWILTVEDLCWDEFEILIDENCAFEKGDTRNKIRRESLKIIGILKKYIELIITSCSKLKNIPERIQQILYEFIRPGAYFPKKYLSTFQISRLDFDFMGKTRNITDEQSAMIIGFLLLSIISAQEILSNIRENVKQLRNYPNVLISAKYISSILHILVRKSFINDVEPLDDIFALFNYYRNYGLDNDFIEKKENKNISKDNYEFEGLPNVNEDEYDKYFIKEDEIEIFFSSNNEFVEIFKNNVFIWALKLAKLIKDKFSRKDPYLLPKKKIDKPKDKKNDPNEINNEKDKEDKSEKDDKKEKDD